MPWENFALCPQADRADSNQLFQKRVLLYLKKRSNRGILDLLLRTPKRTLVRIHLADQALWIEAVEPPKGSQIFLRGLSRWVDARDLTPTTPMAVPWVPERIEAEPRAMAFFMVDDISINPYSFYREQKVTRLNMLGGVRMSDLVETSRFRLHASYELDRLEYEALQDHPAVHESPS